MATLLIIIAIVVGYAFAVFVLLRLIAPHMGFSREAVPAKIPQAWQTKIEELNSAAVSDMDYLEKSFDYITARYSGSHARTVLNFWKGFGNAFAKPAGFLPCNMQNYLLRVMLVRSGRFAESDIRLVTMSLNFFIHQYLDVSVRSEVGGGVVRVVHADPWAVCTGKKSGEHAMSVFSK